MPHPNLRLALLLAAVPTAVLAVTPVGAFQSDQGGTYVLVDPAQGVAIRSTGPVTYHVGAAGLAVSGIETLDFARDCRVTSSLLGEGTWGQGPGGVLGAEPGPIGITATFAGPVAVEFPGQMFPGLADVCRWQ